MSEIVERLRCPDHIDRKEWTLIRLTAADEIGRLRRETVADLKRIERLRAALHGCIEVAEGTHPLPHMAIDSARRALEESEPTPHPDGHDLPP